LELVTASARERPALTYDIAARGIKISDLVMLRADTVIE
jgi:hypothetical protein